MNAMDDIDDSQAPLLDHLVELRKRLLWCVVALAIAFAGCYYFAEQIFSVLVQPLAAAGQNKLVNIDPFEGFFVRLKVAFFAAMMIAFPVISSQLLAFVAPGLYRRERRALLPFILATPLLFTAGCALAYFVTIPTALHFLGSFQGDLGNGVTQETMLSTGKYLGFVMQFLFAFGACFLLPVLIMLLERAGIVTYDQLVGFWRYAVVAAFAIAAVLTPPDIASQFLLAVPLIALYVLTLAAIWFTRRRRDKAAPEAGEPEPTGPA